MGSQTPRTLGCPIHRALVSRDGWDVDRSSALLLRLSFPKGICVYDLYTTWKAAPGVHPLWVPHPSRSCFPRWVGRKTLKRASSSFVIPEGNLRLRPLHHVESGPRRASTLGAPSIALLFPAMGGIECPHTAWYKASSVCWPASKLGWRSNRGLRSSRERVSISAGIGFER